MLSGIALAVTLRGQGRLKLRRPTDDQLGDIATPIGRILHRRVDLERWGPDLEDVLTLAAATGAYVSDGPIIETVDVDPGQVPQMPTDPEGTL